jgi:hypothetical protein
METVFSVGAALRLYNDDTRPNEKEILLIPWGEEKNVTSGGIGCGR